MPNSPSTRRKVKKIEFVELWMPSMEGNGIRSNGRNLKLVAKLVNGVPIYLENEWVIQKGWLNKEQADQMIINSGNAHAK